jgi:soluble lytic murein transglycosylase
MRSGVLVCLAALAGCLFLSPAPAAAPAPAAPAVLSPDDVARYRQIVADERAGRFAHADELISQIDDTSLLGYVEAERLLSPHSGRAKTAALVTWLRTYRDLPIAKRVHRLAERRAVRTVRRHHRRVVVRTADIPGLPAANHRGGGYEELEQAESPVVSNAARAVNEQISAAVHAGDPDSAAAALQSLIAANTAAPDDIAKLSRQVCTSYLIEGMDDKAYALGSDAAETGRDAAPRLDWCAGLAAFRLKHFAEAAQHFAVLSAVQSQPETTRAAAAFWAARSFIRAGHPEEASDLLLFASAQQPTFYGLLAGRILGDGAEAGFADPTATDEEFARLMQNAPTHRALALWQVGDKNYRGYVNAEINRGFGQAAGMNLDVAFAYLARVMDVPNLELRASETSAAHGKMLTGLFPIPQYKPLGGYTVDPALVLAFARIETRFQTNAVSPVGARGLMQLMPATARRIGGAGACGDVLLDPAYNLSIGQRYIARLLDVYGGNLIKLGAAYNAGERRVKMWASLRNGKEDDALMFIESMQAPETRSYVKRLLTYYWMYHRRDGNPAPSLDEAARGAWPVYHPPVQSAPPPPPRDGGEEDNDD